MADKRWKRPFGGSGSVRSQEPDGDSPGRAEPEQASRSRSDLGTLSGDLLFKSQLRSRQRSGLSRDSSGSSFADLQSLGPSAIRTELESLDEELRPETLAGPVELIGKPSKIGEGGQFYVYKQEVGFLDRNICNSSFVAVKRPLIQKTDNNPNAPFDLADPKAQESLGHICNEIKALTDERLRRHPNIVKLLSWAFGVEWDRPLVLVLELAYEDLEKALKAASPPPDFLKVRFCSDIAKGLNAIHEAGFLHGDLKPANVLIFREESRFVAKLADFGYSTTEGLQATGGTFDWQAPEYETSALGDCFSYGLLIWSVLFLDGETPPHRRDQTRKKLALAHVAVHRDRYPTWVTEKIRAALGSLLDEEISRRPSRVDVFFAYATEPDHRSL
jgi:serine/threonine protein kinase